MLSSNHIFMQTNVLLNYGYFFCVFKRNTLHFQSASGHRCSGVVNESLVSDGHTDCFIHSTVNKHIQKLSMV